MASNIIERIRKLQAGISIPDDAVPPPHRPEMLFIGCIDARLDINIEIGIPYGKALIYRNVAALVSGTRGDDDPEHVGEAAALEFAVNVMQIKDIVVMGHTDCGGINACLHGVPGARHVMQYLLPLNEIRNEVTSQAGNLLQIARKMEQAAVRQSVTNLMTYDAVAQKVTTGELTLHGWVINTATRRISEMDLATGVFHPMR